MTAPDNDALRQEISDMARASVTGCWTQEQAIEAVVNGPVGKYIAELTRKLDEARADRQTLTKALTGLTCSGSEFFIRRGDECVADAEACVAWIRRSRENQQASVKSAWAERRKADQREAEAQARISALEAALKPFCFGDPAIEGILYAGMSDEATGTFTISLGNIRRARAALHPAKTEEASDV